MYGAIIGDLSGSTYEYHQFNKTEPVKVDRLIDDKSFFSDDTILTMAILDAIINGNCNYEEYLRRYALKYKNYLPRTYHYFQTIFSPGFTKWAMGEKEGNSVGNGAMMRISPVGYLFDTEEEVIKNARLATIPSHNSEEAIKAATDVALLIFYLRKGYSKDEAFQKLNICVRFQSFKKFNYTCSETFPNCMSVIYTSNSFEEAVMRAVEMGGDTDTNAAIVGSVAEAIYGIRTDTILEANNKIPQEFIDLLETGYKLIKK